jgi:hypothetical protein
MRYLNVTYINGKDKYYLVPKPGQKTVTVSGKALAELEQRYLVEKTKRPTLSFATFISESALMELERRRILREAQFISFIGFEQDTLILRDTRKQNARLVEVQLKDKKLKCITDNDFDCAHVGFALALPEVRIALKR